MPREMSGGGSSLHSMKRLLLLLLTPFSLFAQAPIFETPIEAERLDAAAFGEWADGAEHAVVEKDGPGSVLNTGKTRAGWADAAQKARAAGDDALESPGATRFEQTAWEW